MSQETVTFILNDKELTVPKGTTVMEAAAKENVYIPHFCWHPGLSVAGVCRFCLVKVEGRPKMEIACNLPIVEGMKVNTIDPEVKDAHKWGLEFHLVNHPLDCPICDQAGECKLQDFYMEVGKYKSQMNRPKVLKPKALDVGDDLVLDTERCILCDRCVRFEEEVTKTRGLGIFNRGDRAVIGTYPDRKINHNYQTNIVDICPVGAFTSKDFRFKQRVWFLKDKKAICPGCSTGCHVKVYGKPEVRTYFRVKPEHSDVNGHWMCDVGRRTYSHLNAEHRLRSAVVTVDGIRRRGSVDEAVASLAEKLSTTEASDIALLISPQYTTEEYEAALSLFVNELGVKQVYQWRQTTEDREAFDGLLYRGDHNPNTKGLQVTLEKFGIASAVQNQFDQVAKANPKVVVVLAPEIDFQYPDLDAQLGQLAELPFVSIWTTNARVGQMKNIPHAIPLKGFAEKKGTFLNFEGTVGQLSDPFPSVSENVRDVVEITDTLKGVMSHLK